MAICGVCNCYDGHTATCPGVPTGDQKFLTGQVDSDVCTIEKCGGCGKEFEPWEYYVPTHEWVTTPCCSKRFRVIVVVKVES